jgi:hypothetical protein
MLQAAKARIDRVDLARALADVAHADRRLAASLAVCEAWNAGYCANVVNLAADLSANDDPSHQSYSSHRERSLQAVQRSVDICNPRHRAAGFGDVPAPEAVQALLTMLTAQVCFHEAAVHVERRRWHRTPPPA